MGIRRKGREMALQMLYEWDLAAKDFAQLQGELPWQEQSLELGEDLLRHREELIGFASQLVEGVLHNAREIDGLIEGHSTHWKVSRMSLVDRNVLRLAVFEMLYSPAVPSSVVLNEAIDIAKAFGSEESGAFVNGILDCIARDLKKE